MDAPSRTGNGLPKHDRQGRLKPQPFFGFDLPWSNTTYCPNQFFDVVLPHSSRPVVRIVAYLIRQTLGWADADGHPIHEKIKVTYRELVERAGVSRGSIRQALDDAVKARFIRCIKKGRAKSAGTPSESAQYELCWSGDAEYVKDPKRFRGFYEGEGNRTDIPNQFFDYVIPNEALSVVKVVGSIIRFSIGFQTRRGRRRQRVALSYNHLQDYARIGSRADLSSALQTALNHNYVTCVLPGVVAPSAKDRKAATYTLRWAETPTSERIGSKTVPAESTQHRFKNRTSIGSKTVPADRFKNRTILNETTNETLKQQQQAAAVDREDVPSFEKLKQAGFDDTTAARLASVRSLDHIENQIAWLPRRAPTKNPLGMLRRAIEENWPEPPDIVARTEAFTAYNPALTFAKHFYAGYGDNPGAPAAEPSRNDLEAADRYVARLLEIWPEPDKLSEWGRAFGRFVRDEHASRRGGGLASLVVGLRNYGDAFLARHQQARKYALIRQRETTRAQYEAEHTPAWLAYLRDAENHCREHDPTDYNRFVTWRAAKRERILKSPFRFASQAPVEATLAHFDSDEQRLRDFQDFFRSQVYDFATWNRERNAAPCQP